MVFTALLLGFAGSLHCVGMCSPLVVTVTARGAVLRKRIVYNAGRLLTYGLLGAGAGLSGYVISREFQNLVSIAIGLGLLLMGVFGMSGLRIPLITKGVNHFTSLLKQIFGKLIQRKNLFSFFLMGSFNGLLPCGLTFVALSACLILPGPQQGFYFMLFFGLGTLPAMLGIPFVIQNVTRWLHVNPARLATSLLILSGCLLITRVLMAELPHASSIPAGIADIVLCR